MSVIRFTALEYAPIVACARAAGLDGDAILDWLTRTDTANRKTFAQRYGELTPAVARAQVAELAARIEASPGKCRSAASTVRSIASNTDGKHVPGAASDDAWYTEAKQLEHGILAFALGGAPPHMKAHPVEKQLNVMYEWAREADDRDEKVREYEKHRSAGADLRPYTPPPPNVQVGLGGRQLESYSTREAVERVRAALKARTGRTFSVKGTPGGGIVIDAPPARRQCDSKGRRVVSGREYRAQWERAEWQREPEQEMTHSCREDRELIAKALAVPASAIHHQGYRANTWDSGCTEELVARAEGRTPTRWCQPDRYR